LTSPPPPLPVVSSYRPDGSLFAQRTWLDLASAYPHYPTIADIKEGLADEALKQSIDLGPFMSPTPYTIQALAPLSRVIALFRPMGLRHLPVVDKVNNIVGMITRKDLVEPALHESLLAGMNKVATPD